MRRDFTHVSDIAPTIMDMAGVPLADMVNNVKQQPMEGHSFAATTHKGGQADKDRAQYVELLGNRGLWQGDWSLVATHRIRTWAWGTPQTFDEPWELYDLSKDLGQTTDLAARYPERVAQMEKLFDEQAARYNVRPYHNMEEAAARGMAEAKQDFISRQGKWRYPGPVSNITGQEAPPVNIRGFTMTARLGLESGTETGPLFAYGGQLGGIGLYLKEGKPVLIMNGLDGTSDSVMADKALAAGSHAIELKLARGRTAEDGTGEYRVTISSGDTVLVDRPMRFRMAQYFGLPATFGVGEDEGSPVMKGYRAGVPFPGRISDVVFDFSATGPGATELH